MTNISYIHVSLELWGCIFCLIAATCSFIERKIDAEGSKLLILIQLNVMVLLFHDAFAWIFRGNITTLGYYVVRISNFMVFAVNGGLMLLITLYIVSIHPETNQRTERILVGLVCLVCVLEWGLLIISQFTGLYYDFDQMNRYYRKDFFWLSQVTGIIVMGVDTVLIMRKRKHISRLKFIALLSYVVLPILALIIQIFVYGIAFLNISITVSALLMFAESLVERSKRMVVQERELSQARIDILLSQMQPHFLFNSLTTIRHLCREDTDLAVETIDEFAGFLRECTDSLHRKTCISFSRELEIVKHYLYLEQKRFGDRLHIVYDIQTVLFELPAFSVQPIVENAVKHGIMEKVEGGTVTITTLEEESCYIVCVEDNGVGIDLAAAEKASDHLLSDKAEEKKNHVGIENVSNRLRLMCGGTLEMTGTPGIGTKVKLRIPKVRMEEVTK